MSRACPGVTCLPADLAAAVLPAVFLPVVFWVPPPAVTGGSRAPIRLGLAGRVALTMA